MPQIRLLAGAGLAALLVSLVALLPAQVALPVAGVPPGALTGISGTLWQGAAERVLVGGMALGPVRWRVRPSRLLLGRLTADVAATLPEGFLNGAVALAPGGALELRDLEAAAPLAWLAPAMGTGLGGSGTQLTARFERLALESGRVTTAIGSLQVAGIVLPLQTGVQLGAGNYSVTFDAQDLGPDEPLTGALKDAGGPLEIAGTVTVNQPRSYELTGTVRARPDAPPDLQNALQMLGPATADGSRALSLAGSF